jgi:DNA gyrase/topoisomerase IV subunit A
MVTSEKIEEWLREVEQRPESAPLIIQFIGNRLRDLAAWNEALRSENIALASGNRVEEYEQRIAHLEYQLDLLKRQLGGEALQAGQATTGLPAQAATISLLVFDHLGRVLRIVLDPTALEDGVVLGYLQGDLGREDEPPRLLAVPSSEELFFVFTYGRVAAISVEELAQVPAGGSWEWEQAPVPEARRSREALACLTPVARLALAEFLIQFSRRGYVKKVLASMAASILSQQYIGAGTVLPVDKIFAMLLGAKDSRIALVSHEGRLLCLEAGQLPFSIEEAMRLEPTDHLVTAAPLPAGKTLLVMTQIGKLVALDGDDLPAAPSFKLKGQAIFSGQRRASGVRVVGAAAVDDADWAIALHADGRVSLHAVSSLLGRGTLPAQGELLAFATFAV